MSSVDKSEILDVLGEVLDDRVAETVEKVLEPKLESLLDQRLGALVRKNLRVFWGILVGFCILISGLIGWEYHQNTDIATVNNKIEVVNKAGSEALAEHLKAVEVDRKEYRQTMQRVEKSLTRIATKLGVEE